MRQCDMKWRTVSYYHKGNSKLCAAALEMNFVPHHHLAPSMWHPPPESGAAHGGEP